MSDLQDLNGVGNSVEEKLVDAGIESINAVANKSPEELVDQAGLGEKRAKKIYEQADARGVPLETGVSVEEEQSDKRYVTTGMDMVDEMLGGGLCGGYIIGVSGEPKAGKTQFVLQMLASALDYEEGNAIYVETEPNRFEISRLKSLCREEDSYKDVVRIQAHSDEERDDVDNIELQRNSYDAIREGLEDVSLIVVDSFQANFRLSGRYKDRSDLPERNSEIAYHLQKLQSLSNHFDCPVLITLQVMGNPDQFSGSTHDIWGPTLMDHTITHLIHLSHGKGDLRKIELKGHPALPDDSVTIKIPENSPIEVV